MRASPALYDAADDNVKNGNEQQVQGGGGDHASENGGADGNSAGATGTGGEHQGYDAQNKCEGSHQDRAQTDFCGFDGGLYRGTSVGAQLLRELDDQNGILAGQADEHDQADLAVHVVLQTAQSDSADRTKECNRNGQQDDEGKHETFVL